MDLGDISPLAGIATGKGLMGKIAGSGGMGLIPAMFARNAQKKDEAEEARELARIAEADQREKDALAARNAPVPAAVAPGMRKGGRVNKSAPTKTMASGGAARSSASKRADGIAQRGKTRA